MYFPIGNNNPFTYNSNITPFLMAYNNLVVPRGLYNTTPMYNFKSTPIEMSSQYYAFKPEPLNFNPNNQIYNFKYDTNFNYFA